MSPTRRQVLKASAVAGAAAVIGVPELLAKRTAAAATIDPASIPKYVTPLFVLPAMPPSRILPDRDEYSVAARRFTQQVLPATYPATTVFGFGSTTERGTNHTPGYTIEAGVDRQVRIDWINQFVDPAGNYVSSLLPIDPTLHWANPPGGIEGRDSHPSFKTTPKPYTGPLPLVVHLHGSHDYEESDGYPEAWYLPVARNIPSGYATEGSFYEQYKAEARQRNGVLWRPGSATYVFDNDQRATNLFYHDHSLGMTRTSVRSGLLGEYMLRGGTSDLPPGVLPGPAPRPGDRPGGRYYELALVFSDPSFNADGSYFYPTTSHAGPYIPQTDIPPYWTSPVFGDTITVNGNTWPFLHVEQRRYRFRMLNACNSRTLAYKIVSDPSAPTPREAALPLWVIGSDGGFLPTPVAVEGKTALPATATERYDVIVDFTNVPVGTKLYLVNEGGASSVDTTGQMLQFQVVPLASRDTSTPPDQLGNLPGYRPLPAATNTRKVSFGMRTSTFDPTYTAEELCGTVNPDGTFNPLEWFDPMTERPTLGSTEIWEVYNFARFAHDFHVHLVEFQVQDRQPIGGGPTTPPLPWETGDKDSAEAPGGQITRIKATFDHLSRYVWHCHFLEHEDNGMMRPWEVVRG